MQQFQHSSSALQASVPQLSQQPAIPAPAQMTSSRVLAMPPVDTQSNILTIPSQNYQSQLSSAQLPSSMFDIDEFNFPDLDPYALMDHPDDFLTTEEPDDEEFFDSFQEANRTIRPSSIPSHTFPSSQQEPPFYNSLTTPDEYHLHQGAPFGAADSLGLAPTPSHQVPDSYSIAHHPPTAIAGAGGDQFFSPFDDAAPLLGSNRPGHQQSAASAMSSDPISAVELQRRLSTPTHTVSFFFCSVSHINILSGFRTPNRY